MRKLVFGVIFTAVWMFAGAVYAQQTVWVQIEAKRNLSEAQQSVRAYSARLQNVSGFVMSTGWYAIALGPFERTEADLVLSQLRATGQIAGDSFIAFSDRYRQQFWPIGATSLTALPVVPSIEADLQPEETVVVQPLIPTEETAQDARRSEAALGREDRMLLQTAMKWDGYYFAAIDGAFGPGTRNAMAAWQDANRYEATGVLTTKQRKQLIDAYQDMLASIDLRTVLDSTAGINIELPLAMVEFDKYEPPFAHYKSINDSGVKVLLISQTGDEFTLRGLYDIMQTLEIVPLEGAREIGSSSFTLTGQNNQISSYTYARQSNGQVKGFTLIWPAGEDRRRQMVIDAMRASFAPLPEAVLPDVLDNGGAAQSVDLMAELAIRKPDMSRSGFYIDAAGSVLTTIEAVNTCDRITLDDLYEAEVVASDTANGFALLQPSQSLVPAEYARFLSGIPRLNTEVAVAGYSYDGLLGAPSLTYGTLEDLRGLQGEPTIKRLALAPTASDAGGPVFDTAGSVMGMLLPTVVTGGRVLPADVSFAADSGSIVEFLSANGRSPAPSELSGSIAPEDLTTVAANMTVLVSCWN